MRSGAQEEVSTESLTQGMPLTPSLPQDRTEGQTAQDLAGPRSKESSSEKAVCGNGKYYVQEERGRDVCMFLCVAVGVHVLCVGGSPCADFCVPRL